MDYSVEKDELDWLRVKYYCRLDLSHPEYPVSDRLRDWMEVDERTSKNTNYHSYALALRHDINQEHNFALFEAIEKSLEMSVSAPAWVQREFFLRTHLYRKGMTEDFNAAFATYSSRNKKNDEKKMLDLQPLNQEQFQALGPYLEKYGLEEEGDLSSKRDVVYLVAKALIEDGMNQSNALDWLGDQIGVEKGITMKNKYWFPGLLKEEYWNVFGKFHQNTHVIWDANLR